MFFAPLLFACYRFIAVPSLLVTGVTTLVLSQAVSLPFLVYTIWTKVVTTLLLVGYVHFFRSGEFYFFNNLGISRSLIYRNMIVLDGVLAGLAFSFVFTFL